MLEDITVKLLALINLTNDKHCSHMLTQWEDTECDANGDLVNVNLTFCDIDVCVENEKDMYFF